MYQIVVVGGGPAGIMAAMTARRILWPQARVALVDSSPRIGQKILLTGGKRCNYGRRMSKEELLGHYPGSLASHFLQSAFSACSCKDIEETLKEWGVEPLVEGAGEQLYSKSMATGLRLSCENALRAAGVEVLCGLKLYDFSHEALSTKDGVSDKTAAEQLIHLHLEACSTSRGASGSGSVRKQQMLTCNRLILACGGASYPQTGSDGSVLEVLKTKGIACMDYRPALVGLHLQDSYLQELVGLSVDCVRLELSQDRKAAGTQVEPLPQKDEYGKKLGKVYTQGPMLLTHKGVGGRAVMDLSRWVSRYGYNRLRIDWVPYSYNEASERERQLSLPTKAAHPAIEELQQLVVLKERLLERDRELTTSRLYREQLPERLRRALIVQAGLEWGVKLSSLSNKQLRALFCAIHAAPFEVQAYPPLEQAVASTGGISLKELKSQSMELKALSGVYAAGELIDIDGNCGGYSFIEAWSTGHLAGMQAARSLQAQVN